MYRKSESKKSCLLLSILFRSYWYNSTVKCSVNFSIQLGRSGDKVIMRHGCWLLWINYDQLSHVLKPTSVRFFWPHQEDVTGSLWLTFSVETLTVIRGLQPHFYSIDSVNWCTYCTCTKMSVSVKGLFLRQGMPNGWKIVFISVRSGARHVSSHAPVSSPLCGGLGCVAMFGLTESVCLSVHRQKTRWQMVISVLRRRSRRRTERSFLKTPQWEKITGSLHIQHIHR